MTQADVVVAGDETSQADWFAEWDNALRGVELDVVEAESLIEQLHAGVDDASPRTVVNDWVAPNLLGPMPVEFADRARALLQRQSDVSERLAEAMIQARSQKRALGKFDRAERPPVFIDTAL